MNRRIADLVEMLSNMQREIANKLLKDVGSNVGVFLKGWIFFFTH